MSDILRMRTTPASPDALRQLLQLSKSFYNLHTSKYFGYEDLDGLQYVGTSENFGSEILIETRKLRMNRPPEKIIHPSEMLSYFFNISHSDFINVYPQQNLLMGCVKTDVLLPNHAYGLKFTDVTIRYFARAEAYSDQNSCISAFYSTLTNPVLLIDGDEYPLYVGNEDNTDEHVTWYFAINQTTRDKSIYDMYNRILTIHDLTQFIDLPALWLCTSDMRILPPMRWYQTQLVVPENESIHWDDLPYAGNEDYFHRPLLEFGVNGNDTILLFPYMYGIENVPDPSFSTGFWYVKVYGDFVGTTHDEYNLNTKVTRIGFIHCPTESFTDEPDFEYYSYYDDKYVKVSLTEFNLPEELRWTFRKPVNGDYDYDPSGIYNPIVACMFLNGFENNVVHSLNERKVFYPMFKVSFKDEYYHPYESEINAMNAGIHIDNSTDYTTNAVDKRFGIIRNLCEFDGLPSYYKYYLDRTIHHAHVEMYAIRDDANVRNQHAMDKQTAAIILDSGVPITDYAAITKDMKPVIKYQGPHTFTYVTDESAIVSKMNFLSDTGFIDRNHFCDVTIPGAKYTHKFVYHGNRFFSTGIIEFDPDTEYGRGYLITNDGAAYENNATSKVQKAPRTAARICDIPTSFVQLQNITNLSPTLVIDPDYVRSYASWNDEKYLTLWNYCQSDWYAPYQYRSTARLRFPSMALLTSPMYSSKSNVIDTFGDVRIPNRTVNVSDCEFTLSSGGAGYHVDDTFGFNIGGLFFRGTVTATEPIPGDPDGKERAFDFEMEINRDIPGQPETDNVEIPFANIGERETYRPATKLTGSGNGIVIKLTVPQEIWDYRDSTEIGYRKLPNENLFAFVRDDMNRGIHAIKYDYENECWNQSSMIQITGDLSIGNPAYEDLTTVERRTLLGSYLYNMFTNRNLEEDFILQYTSGEKTIDIDTKICSYQYPEMTIEKLITDPEDLHKLISDNGLNKWNSFVAAVPKLETQSDYDQENYYTIAWSYDMNASYINGRFGNGNLIFPKFSGLNISSYDNSWSSIKFTIANNLMIYPFMYDIMHATYDEYLYNYGQLSLQTSSVISLASILKIDSETYPSDAARLHNITNLNYNLYRFDHMKPFEQLEELRVQLSEMTSSELYDYILEKFGSNTDISRLYSYTELEYEVGQTYQRDSFIVYPNIITVPYEERKPYIGDTIVVDIERNMYRVDHTYVSTSLEYDKANNLIIPIGVKPTGMSATLYTATKNFVASSIEDDTSNGNMKYVGPSTKFNTMVDYVISRTYPASVYDNPDLVLFARKGQSMKIPNNTPIGGFVPLVNVLDINVSTHGTQRTVEPLYVFRLEPTPTMPIPDLTKFRMYKNGEDISECTMLIVHHESGYRKYTFHDGKWEWAYV